MNTDHVPPHVEVALTVGAALDALGLPHMVCGSVASSVHGEPRSTHDIDFVVDFSEQDEERLAAALADEFFVDPEALRYAARSRSSCNVLHRATGIKVDLIVLRDRAFSREELARRIRVTAGAGRQLSVTTAEDMVLSKLEWFAKGGESSENQWRDVCGLLKHQGDGLDDAYLDTWAPRIGVQSLLARARSETRST